MFMKSCIVQVSCKVNVKPFHFLNVSYKMDDSKVQLVLLSEKRDILPHISCTQALFLFKFDLFSSSVTLKTMAKSPKSNQNFSISQCFIQANLVPIGQLVQKISYTQVSIKQTPTRSPPKTIYPLPIGGGHKNGRAFTAVYHYILSFNHARVYHMSNTADGD